MRVGGWEVKHKLLAGKGVIKNLIHTIVCNGSISNI